MRLKKVFIFIASTVIAATSQVRADPLDVFFRQTEVNTSAPTVVPIINQDFSSSMALDKEVSNGNGSGRARADIGILGSESSINGSGAATSQLFQLTGAEFRDDFIINSAVSGTAHVTIPFLVDGTILEAHGPALGTSFAVVLGVTAPTGSQPGGVVSNNIFKNNVLIANSSQACSNAGSNQICSYANTYNYTSSNSFNGPININYDISTNQQFHLNFLFQTIASAYVPDGGLPASLDFFITMTFGGFILPDGDTITSALLGPLTEHNGVFNYPSAPALVPEPSSVILLASGMTGFIMVRRRSRASAVQGRSGFGCPADPDAGSL